MSEYFDVRCVDCGEAAECGNSSRDAMQEVAANWPAVRGASMLEQRLQLAMVDVSWRRPDRDAIDFLRAHESHRLILESEYPDRPIRALILARCSPHIIKTDLQICRVCGATAEEILRNEETRRDHGFQNAVEGCLPGV